MIKKKFILFSISALAVLFISSSCKKCDAGNENVSTGEIIQGAIIYPQTGYMALEYNLFNGSVNPNQDGFFEVSFDGGLTKVAVDYSQYSVMANPMTVNCEASFVRDVTRDNINNLVTYNVTATTCNSCKERRTVENYVLVNKIPDGAYTLQFLNQEIVK
jgi:hypothetical protein